MILKSFTSNKDIDANKNDLFGFLFISQQINNRKFITVL